MTSRLFVVVAVLVVVAACSGSGPSPALSSPLSSAQSSAPSTSPDGSPGSPTASATAGGAAVELTVFGAASLGDVLEAAKQAYEAANAGTTLVISTDSSAALATQIEEGAPADVFLSADTATPQRLADGGLADGEVVAFATNRLTVIVPASNPAAIESPADLARPGVKIIAAGDAAPITGYAATLVANLAAVEGYPEGFEAAYRANVVTREDNVKAVVAKVELGEGDAGIVYVTDAAASSEVATVDVPDGANVPVVYAGVVVKASAHPDPARAFLDWFAGSDGQPILASFGFLPPSR